MVAQLQKIPQDFYPFRKNEPSPANDSLLSVCCGVTLPTAGGWPRHDFGEGRAMKRGLWVAGALALLLGLLFGRESLSYVGTFVGMCRDNAKEAIPVDFQIERAKQEVKNLDPDIARNMHLIAKVEVDLANVE
jgi:hypothetical protein